MALERELATFAKERDQLLAESEGRFVLIIGDEVKGTYASYDDALQEGYKLAGLDRPFLVKAITRIETAAHFTRPLVLCQASA
jgi:hypothetical protein